MKEIIKICQDIAMLCRQNQSDEWANSFDRFVDELEYDDWNATKRRILSIYGGMGSFSDLVWDKNGIPLIKENNELDRLSTKLYKLVTDNW